MNTTHNTFPSTFMHHNVSNSEGISGNASFPFETPLKILFIMAIYFEENLERAQNGTSRT